MIWRGRLLNIYPSLLPTFFHSSLPVHDVLQAGVRIIGVKIHFIDEFNTDNDRSIIAKVTVSVRSIETGIQLEYCIRLREQQLYSKALDIVASKKIGYQ
ncbi:unnamed protein product [Rotaria sp. Silwood2]|nr:unnamed protein product [Rotaria sp. Silwood2]